MISVIIVHFFNKFSRSLPKVLLTLKIRLMLLIKTILAKIKKFYFRLSLDIIFVNLRLKNDKIFNNNSEILWFKTYFPATRGK